MIDSDKNQQQQYKILLAAFDKMISLLKEGIKQNLTFGDIYSQIKDLIISKDKNLKNCIPECMGYSVGMELSNEYLKITENCKIPVQNGMAIIIFLSLENLNQKIKII